FAGELPAIKRRVVRFGTGLRCIEGPALPGIEDRHVGMTAAEKSSASAKIDNPRRTCGEELDNAGERDFLAGVQNGHGESQSGFEAGDAERCTLKLDDLFVRSVRSMVGGDSVNGAIGESGEKRVSIGS